MGKSNKRRKIISQVSHLSNLTGFEGAAETTLDDCMAEFQQQQLPSSQLEEDSSNDDTKLKQNKISNFITSNNYQPSWLRQNSCMSPEEIDIWNRSFCSWATGRSSGSNGGNHHPYTPGLLPNIDEELARNFKIKELSSLLLKRCSGCDLRMPVFERWLLDSKLEDDHQTSSSFSSLASTSSSVTATTRDPILPLQASPKSKASQRLLEEILATTNHKRNNTTIQRQEAEEIVAELCRKTNLYCQELLSQRDRYLRQSPLNKGDRITMEDESNNEKDVVSILYSRKKWKKPFCFKLNRKHYESLKKRFVEVHDSTRNTIPSSDTSSVWPPSPLSDYPHYQNSSFIDRSFHVIVLALLLRYSALSGGQLLEDLRGGGMQGAIHSDVFDVLQDLLGPDDGEAHSTRCWLEGFASPFNATMPRFASAFPDLDWHFGAVGTFFDCYFGAAPHNDAIQIAEYCEANPPFSIAVMESMVNRMIGSLARAQDDDRELTFVVIVPSGMDTDRGKISTRPNMPSGDREGNSAVVKQNAQQSFEAMVESKFCTKHIRLKAREHGYVEGAQHLRPTMFKTSSYDTSVILLQTLRARISSSKMDQLERKVRKAFLTRHEDEMNQRKTKP